MIFEISNTNHNQQTTTMYLPPMIMVALMQVAGSGSGEQIASIPVSQPMMVAKVEPRLQVTPPTDLHKNPKSESKVVQVTANEEKNKPKTNVPESHVVSKPDAAVAATVRGIDAQPNGRQAILGRDAEIQANQGTVANVPVNPAILPQDTMLPQGAAGADNRPKGNISVSLGDNDELFSMAVVETRQVVLSAGLQGILKEFRVPKTDPRTDEVILDKNGDEILVPITEGLIVKKGQILGKIDDSVEQSMLKTAEARLNISKTEAKRTIEIEYAQVTYDLVAVELAKYLEMNKDVPGSIPHMQVLETQTRLKQAEKQWQKADEDHRLIRPREVQVQLQEVNAAKEKIKQRTIICPIDGMVVECTAKEGEWFREGDKMIRIVPLDKLYIRGRVDATRLTTGMLFGKQVTVRAQMVDGRVEEFTGVVDFASPELQLATKEFFIHANVDNRRENGSWLLRINDRVDMIIHLDKDGEIN